MQDFTQNHIDDRDSRTKIDESHVKYMYTIMAESERSINWKYMIILNVYDLLKYTIIRFWNYTVFRLKIYDHYFTPKWSYTLHHSLWSIVIVYLGSFSFSYEKPKFSNKRSYIYSKWSYTFCEWSYTFSHDRILYHPIKLVSPKQSHAEQSNAYFFFRLKWKQFTDI